MSDLEHAYFPRSFAGGSKSCKSYQVVCSLCVRHTRDGQAFMSGRRKQHWQQEIRVVTRLGQSVWATEETSIIALERREKIDDTIMETLSETS